ncbi:MAG: ATP synthase F0 subunit C [Proteobacteria bacterium]|nr:ATP synthase F0 subunit C [Pseudomonadota bacterium]
MHEFGKLAFWALVILLTPFTAYAQEASEAVSQAISTGMPFMGPAIGAGIATGLAGLGCGIGQGLTAGNTTAGIARNPGAAAAINTPFILGMVLIESIAIYGLLIGILLWLKIP